MLPPDMPNKKNSSFYALVLLTGFGMFLSTFDTGVMNLVVPYLTRHLNKPLNLVIWIITAYSMALSCSIIIFGKMADRFGKTKFYLIGILIFAISSLLCAIAHNIYDLIGARVLQGFGAAMIQATSIPILLSAVPLEKRPQALSYLGILLGLGPMLGPSLGGLILSWVGWRWIFLLNLPISLLILLMGRSLKYAESYHIEPINYKTLGLFTLSLMLLLLGINSPKLCWFILSFICAAVLITWTIAREKFSKNPILPHRLYYHPDFFIPVLGSFVLGSATMIMFLVPPIYFHLVQNMTPWQIGLISLPGPAALILSARYAGAQTQHISTKKLMMIGLVFMTLASFSLSFITDSWTWTLILPCIVFYGIGAGIFQTPSISHLLAHTPSSHHATASSCLRMIQNAGIGIGAMIAGILIHHFRAALDILWGIKLSFGYACLLLVITYWGTQQYLKK